MIDWPAKFFRRKEGEAAAMSYRAIAPRRRGDGDLFDAALGALRTVIDPGRGINIVDLGLVHRLTVRREMVEAELWRASPSCPFADHIVGQACGAIRRAVDDEIAVKVTFAGATARETM